MNREIFKKASHFGGEEVSVGCSTRQCSNREKVCVVFYSVT